MAKDYFGKDSTGKKYAFLGGSKDKLVWEGDDRYKSAWEQNIAAFNSANESYDKRQKEWQESRPTHGQSMMDWMAGMPINLSSLIDPRASKDNATLVMADWIEREQKRRQKYNQEKNEQLTEKRKKEDAAKSPATQTRSVSQATGGSSAAQSLGSLLGGGSIGKSLLGE